MTSQTDAKKRDATRGETCSSREPSVREMLDDPVVQAVMAVDRVTRDDLVAMINQARERRVRRMEKSLYAALSEDRQRIVGKGEDQAA
jgi:hypothetical protein